MSRPPYLHDLIDFVQRGIKAQQEIDKLIDNRSPLEIERDRLQVQRDALLAAARAALPFVKHGFDAEAKAAYRKLEVAIAACEKA